MCVCVCVCVHVCTCRYMSVSMNVGIFEITLVCCVPCLPVQSVTALALAEKDRGSAEGGGCLLYTSPSPRDSGISRMPSSA